MYFLYIKNTVDTRVWEKEVYHEYHKINVFVRADAEIVKKGKGYAVKDMGIMYFDPFESHYGRPNFRQTVEYFELLIPRNFFFFSNDAQDTVKDLHIENDFFTMENTDYKELLSRLFDVREKLKRGEKDLFVLGEILNTLSYVRDKQFACHGKSVRLSSAMSEIIDYIDRNYLETNTVESLAKKLGVSVSYICRLFKTQMSETPYKYITDKKLEFAKELLLNDVSVTEAALEAGFYGSSSFIQIFKRKYGVTPNEYKKLYFSAK